LSGYGNEKVLRDDNVLSLQLHSEITCRNVILTLDQTTLSPFIGTISNMTLKCVSNENDTLNSRERTSSEPLDEYST
jgi:hypothetical protein